MSLLFLLLVPTVLCLVAFALSRGKIDIREWATSQVIVTLIVVIPYCIALWSKTEDTEIWNGVVASKAKTTHHCCHPYCCQYCTSCTTDSKGNTSCSTYCCQTCYVHSHDVRWDAYSSNNEHIYADSCNGPSTAEPARYTAIRIGEPTAYPHSYKNYIKGNPDTLLKRTGQVERFKNKIPPYPEVYDYYRAQRFIQVGVKLPNPVGLHDKLSEVNAKWGAARKVNITVVVVRETDQMYLEALREAWIGGKINDLVVAVGLYDDSSTVAWAGVISWTQNEQIKVDLRNRILDMQGGFDGFALINAIDEEVSAKFEHRRISEFQYLEASITPSKTVKWVIGIIAVLVALGLQVFFWLEDPFDNGFRRSYNRYRY